MLAIFNTKFETAKELGLSIETIEADNYFNDISGLIQKYGSVESVIESGANKKVNDCVAGLKEADYTEVNWKDIKAKQAKALEDIEKAETKEMPLIW